MRCPPSRARSRYLEARKPPTGCMPIGICTQVAGTDLDAWEAYRCRGRGFSSCGLSGRGWLGANRLHQHGEGLVQVTLPVRPGMGAWSVKVGSDRHVRMPQRVDEVEGFGVDLSFYRVGGLRGPVIRAGLPIAGCDE